MKTSAMFIIIIVVGVVTKMSSQEKEIVNNIIKWGR